MKTMYTTVAEVARAIGANAHGLRLLNYLNEHFPQDALDYDFIMERAQLAAQAVEDYVREHGTDAVNQLRAQELANEILMGVYASAYSKYDDVFNVCDMVLYDAWLKLEHEQIKEIALRLLPQFEPVFEKYPVGNPEFTALPQYDELKKELSKKAQVLLKPEIEKIKKAEQDKLPF